MAEKYVNYVNLSDGTDLLDLRRDTIKDTDLRDGVTAHDSTGKPIVGKAIDADTVDGWNVKVISDGSDPENITKPTLTFVYTVG